MSSDRPDRRIGLPNVEASYLAQVDAALRDLPEPVRRPLRYEAAELLGERPPATCHAELVDEVGEPSELAASLRASAGLGGRLDRRRRWMMRSTSAKLAQLGAVAFVVVLATVAIRWFSATPDIWNPCGGVIASEVEMLQAAGATEYRATFRQDERFGVWVCPSSHDPGVVIESVSYSVPSRLMIQPVGAELDVDRAGVTTAGDASSFAPFRPADIPWAWVAVWFEMAYCTSDGIISVDSVELDYRYRGRSRSMTLPLGYTASVDAAGKCTPAVRAETEAESDRWVVATGEFFRQNGYPRSDLTALGLTPENVSRDLCRYLAGLEPPRPEYGGFESLGARAVFQLDDTQLAAALIDGAVLGICPEHAERREELVSMLG